MKTISIFALAVLFSNTNLKAVTKVETDNSRTMAKQAVAYRLSSTEVSDNDENSMVSEVERKDVSRIAFKTSIHEVARYAATTSHLDGLDKQIRMAFKLNIKEVGENINTDQALFELAVAEVAFKINIHDVMTNLANTDTGSLEHDNSNAVKFALQSADVEDYARSVDLKELAPDDPCYACTE